MRRAKDLLLKMTEEHSTTLLNYATLQGKYEESRHHNEKLLEFRKQQSDFYKTCAETITDIQAVATVAISESGTHHDRLVAQIRDQHTSNLTSLQDAKNTLKNTIGSTLTRLTAHVDDTPTQHTYSAATKSPSTGALKQQPTSKPDTSVLLVYPKQDNKRQTSEETRDSIQKAIQLTQLEIRISKPTKIRNRGIALELPKGQIGTVADKLGSTLSTHTPKKKLPKVKVFDLPTTDESDQTILENIRKQNFPDVEKTKFNEKRKTGIQSRSEKQTHPSLET